MGIRTSLQERVIDRIQFLVDSRPRLDYQPLPWAGAGSAKRSQGTRDRWTLIEPELVRLDPSTALDIGSNVGFFSLSMAERGISVVGIECERRFLRLARHAARVGRIDDVAFLDTRLSPDSMWMVPRADVVLLLSVYHHWVRGYGAGRAAELLAATWAHAARGMFFETGQAELPDYFNHADLGDDPETALRTHLEDVCPESKVRCLGTSLSLTPGVGDENAAPATRHLFLLERT